MADYGSIKERWTRVVSSDNSNPIASPASPLSGDGAGRVLGTGSETASSPQTAAPQNAQALPVHTLPASPPTRSLSDGTFIGNGALFEGTLTLRGDFRIDTEFRGELETDGTITIEAGGSVVGCIRAREVVIRGAVVGNVIAPRQLIVESTGKLHGDIETACLEIQKHAFFQGNTSMNQPQSTRRPGANLQENPASATPAAPVA